MSERKPLLSDEDAKNILKNCAYSPREMDPVTETRAFYEDLIDRGELMVVKTATNEHGKNHINMRTFYCSNCHTHTERVFRHAPPGSPRTVKFCPGCGSKIVEP